MRLVTYKNGQPTPSRHKFGLVYTGLSRVKRKDHIRMTPMAYPENIWDKIRCQTRTHDKSDIGCKHMRAFRLEKAHLDREEAKQKEMYWNEMMRDNRLFEQYDPGLSTTDLVATPPLKDICSHETFQEKKSA